MTPHGLARYQKHGCRCDICRAANTQAMVQWRKRLRESVPPLLECRTCEVTFTSLQQRSAHMRGSHADDPLALLIGAQPSFDTAEAACAGQWDLMWPESNGDVAAAKAVCLTCPLIDPCRDWALDNREVQGVWGGVWFGSAKERAAARRRRTA